MSIIQTHPNVASEWHPTKNGELIPNNFTSGSNKKVWWLCKEKCEYGCNHEWQAPIASRCGKLMSGCPFCGSNGKARCYHSSIEFLYPYISKEFHPTKNGLLKPSNISSGSGTKLWWICPKKNNCGCEHIWEDSVNHRCLGGRGCPFCTSPQSKFCEHEVITFTHPKIMEEWDYDKNKDINPNLYSSGSRIKVWWKCKNTCNNGCLHEWESRIHKRCLSDSGCPYCCIPRKNNCIHESIIYTHPEIVKQIHPTKNTNIDLSKITYGSSIELWWLCENTCSDGCVHEYKTTIAWKCKTDTNGCPYCSKPPKKVCIHNSIVNKYPQIFEEWHPLKNKDIDPSKLAPGSEVRVWWLCKKNKNHEWESIIGNRCRQTESRGCPFCQNKTESKLFDILIKAYPDIIYQFKLSSCKNKRQLPFDFCIPSKKVIIELDGNQHFKQVSNWEPHTKILENDIYKMIEANKQDYRIIRVYQPDILENDDKWVKNNVISKINNSDTLNIFISTHPNLYNLHIDGIERIK